MRILVYAALIINVILWGLVLKNHLRQLNTRPALVSPPPPSPSPTAPIEPTRAPLSPDRIFTTDKEWLDELDQSKIRTVLATGDVIPSRSVNSLTVAKHDFRWPYEHTADRLRDADITFINLETPLIKDCPVTTEGMVFCGDSRNGEGISFAGVDVASLANNHAGNHGVEGVQETAALLLQNKIDVVGLYENGSQKPVIKDIRGIRFAFLGYNDISKDQPGIADVDEEQIKQEIQAARSAAQVVIVTFHWGAEYQAQPDDRQVELGHMTIDAGADLVIGNHPHWIQPIEMYKGKLITYAHGNFVFDQMWSQKTREGVIGKYYFYDNELIDVEYTPLQIDNYGQPHFVENVQKQRIMDDMKNQTIIRASAETKLLR